VGHILPTIYERLRILGYFQFLMLCEIAISFVLSVKAMLL